MCQYAPRRLSLVNFFDKSSSTGEDEAKRLHSAFEMSELRLFARDGSVRIVIERMNTAKALAAVLILLSATLVRQAHAQQCSAQQSLPADKALDVLNRPLNRGDRFAVTCAIAFMDDLSRAREPGAMEVIARYLDLQSPEKSPAEIGANPDVGFGELYGGEYPAIDYIVRYRNKAIPALIEAIAHSTTGSLESRNAVRALMWIEAPDPPAGVRLLVEAAGKEQGNSYEALMDAAEYAASQYQCRNTVQACHEPLNIGPQ